MDLYRQQQISTAPERIQTAGGKALHEQANFLKGQAAFYERQAKTQEQNYLYQLGKANADSVAEAYEQFKNNPEQLDKELTALQQKMLAEVPQEYHDRFNADFLSRAHQSIRLAENNKTRLIDQQNKDAQVMRLDDNKRDMYTLTKLLASNQAGAEDFAQMSRILDLTDPNNPLNAKNMADGSAMFNGAQKVQVLGEYRKQMLDAGIQNALEMTPQQFYQHAEALEKDQAFYSYQDKDTGVVYSLNMKDLFKDDPELYDQYKNKIISINKNVGHNKANGVLDDQEAQKLATTQLANEVMYDNQMGLIKELVKEGGAGNNVEAMTQLLELSDNVQSAGETGFGNKYKTATKDITKEMMILLRDKNNFDPFGFNNALATGIEILRKDGQAGGAVWSDAQSVYMLREFYARAKESGLDLRSTDSKTVRTAKKLASESINDTIQTFLGGNDKDFNTTFMFGRKVNMQPLGEEYSPKGYMNRDYFVQNLNGKNVKTYPETGIQVEE